MKLKQQLFLLLLCFSVSIFAQKDLKTKPKHIGKISSVEYVTSLESRRSDLLPSDNSVKEAKDKRSIANQIVEGKDPQKTDDYFVLNRHEREQSVRASDPGLVFDGYSSGSQPTDPSLAVGPNHVIVVFNTGFTIYDKAGNQLLGQTAPNPAIFPSGGCCDLTVSYDNAADRWVMSFLNGGGAGAQVAVSDGANPLTSGWYVYNISAINDYQKLSIWSDGYYMTENTSGSNKVWALERSAMLNGDSNAKILGFDLPGIVTSGFFSPQVLNITDDNLPAAGGATVIYMQDNAWSGVSTDHIKLWTIDVDWNNTSNSSISSAQQIPTTPFISVFDNGSFANLTQPGNGRKINIDALQATIMNQAQFRKFATHNSAVFNFVVDTDATSGERAGVRWYEFRQSGDNQPWSLYQEGTYTAPDNRHAWCASLAMDAQGNIGMGYTSMSTSSSSSTVYPSSYFTGRKSTDPLGTMTLMEGLISNGTGRIPGTRYGDYSKIDVDPSDDATFWFITEYYKSSRKGVVGTFQVDSGSSSTDTEAPSVPNNLVANNITSNSATLNWSASSDNVGVTQYNVFIDGSLVGTSNTTSFNVTSLSPLTTYQASVSAQDAAGNISGTASTSFTTLDGGGNNSGEIAAYYFETGLDGWTDGGNDCARTLDSNRSFEGNYSIRLRDDSNSSNAVSPTIDLSGNTQVSIEFHTYASSMENGEDFFVEFFNGSSYQVIGQYASGSDFSNNSFFTDTIVLSSSNYNFNSNNRFRIRCDASANNDLIYFDQVIITGDGAAPATVNNTTVLTKFTEDVTKSVKIYPNPVNSKLNVNLGDATFDQVIIFSSKGNIIRQIKPTSQVVSFDLSNLSQGMYFIKFVSKGLATTKRFLKK